MRSRKSVLAMLLTFSVFVAINPDPVIDWVSVIIGAWLASVIVYFVAIREKKRSTITSILISALLFLDKISALDPYAFFLGFALSPLVFLAGLF